MVFLAAFTLGILTATQDIAISTLHGWSIVVCENAPPAERYAAEELQRFVHERTGATLSLVSRSRGQRSIYVGDSDAFRESSLAFSLNGYGPEEFRIRATARSIAVAGGQPRGTLYGVYQFCEDALGVRFLTAGHLYVPRGPGVTVPYRDRRYKPPFDFRWSYYWEASAHPEFAARLRLNTLTPEARLGGVTSDVLISHTLHYQVPVAKYRDTHPEYFALVDGRRLLDVGGGGPQVCCTNPDVVDIVTRAVLDELDQRPGATNIGVSQNDNPYYCTCETCAAINAREGTPMGAQLSLVNAVAERIAQEHPHVKVGTLAYWYTRKPPRFLKPRSNVQIQLCSFEACNLHAFVDPTCEKNRSFMDDFEGWSAICSDLRLWVYNTNLRYLDLPYPNLSTLQPNVRLFHGRGIRGVFMQSNNVCPAGEMSDLRNYVTARLLWNPELDGAGLRDEFLRLHYGGAAELMRTILSLIEDHAERKGAHPTVWSLPGQTGLDRPLAEHLAALFSQALDVAGDAPFRSRVEKASLCLYRSLFETQGHFEWNNGMARVVYPTATLGLLPTYESLCGKWGMAFDSETTSISDYLESLRAHLAWVPVERLESDVWRLTVLPAFNGELIELYHKPTDEHLLGAWPTARINLLSGTLREWGAKGYDHLAPLAFDVIASSHELRLSKHVPGQAIVTRTISLDGGGGSVSCETTIEHTEDRPQAYQVNVSAEWMAKMLGAPSPSTVDGRTSLYLQTPKRQTLAVTFDTAQLRIQTLEPVGGTGETKMVFATPEVMLEKNGRFTYRYRVEVHDVLGTANALAP